MKAYLMYPDRDFDPARELIRVADPFPHRGDEPFDPWAALPPEAPDLMADLQFDPILSAMAGEDAFLYEVARRAVLGAGHEAPEVIAYRQAILRDVLAHPETVRRIHDLAIDANETARKGFGWLGTRYASGMQGSAITVLEGYMKALHELRAIARDNEARFASPGFHRFFCMVQDELGDDYFDEVAGHLKRLQFRHGVPMTAQVLPDARPGGYVLLTPDREERGWLERLFGPQEESYTLTIAPRDEAGGRALGELRERGLAQVATSLRRSVEHVRSFFDMIRTELAFYIGCLALDARLAALEIPRCIPEAAPPEARDFTCRGLRDLALALSRGADVVGNDIAAKGAGLIVVTGANRGGKSTFLRSAGQAQLMMQAGMIVGAKAFAANVARGVETHFKRSEDRAMVSGKLDEELVRMSRTVDRLRPDALVLFNESFAATNEREGSEIARQVTSALAGRRVKMIHVTHLHSFAQGLTEAREGRIFLRAEPEPDGTPTFRLRPGDPKPRSHGLDVFRRYFTDAA